jgi:DNA-binding MarR family transcriptional regulator
MSKPRYTVDNLEASESIGYLIKRCGALMTQIAERQFESTNVSFTQWTTLMTLCKGAEPISATQLSNYCGHDMGALTRVVDELERRGLVRRERSRRDRRAVEIVITPAGRREAESAKRVIVELLNELVAPYSDAEFTALVGLLQRMLVHMQGAAAASPAAPPPAGRTTTGRQRKAKSGAAA